MSLKQSIVVVNQYTIKSGSKGGSRGGTPGDYVLRYMAREGSTEDLTPVKYDDTEQYIQKYMARSSATETMDSVVRIKDKMREAKGLGGVAFGAMGKYDDGDISMSHRKVKKASETIQKEFDDGKTILKTVLSFELDYLKQVGVVPEDFEPINKGDYRGNVDQMKMRRSIMDGMKKLGRHFDDLAYVGVIQVDTKHVHAHLAMVDRGVGNITPDGTQKGKLSATQIRTLRRGIDDSLDEMNPIKMLSSNVTYDRRNVKCFIKKYTHETMAQQGLPQFLLATLPEDKRLWRASTNRKEMQKSNTIVREYVGELLKEPDSGYDEALRDIGEYANARAEREGLTSEEHRKLLTNGRNRLMDDCVNGVYAVLKQVPKEEQVVRTPMLDAMSLTYDIMADEDLRESDPMVEFGFKLRSYSSRMSHHKKERRKFKDARESYEETAKENDVSKESKALYDFYKMEEEYNAMLLAKYQHFLSFLPPGDEYESEFKDLLDYKDRMRKLELLRDDPSVKRMSPESAEDYGRRVYDMRGGEFAASNPVILDRRLDAMHTTYEKKEDNFRFLLSEYGMTLENKGEDETPTISTEKPYEFHEVKALDLHRLSYDFTYDVPISKINIDEFVATANKRYNSYRGAVDYLEQSGQGEFVEGLPGRDINLMKSFADELSVQGVLKTAVSTGGGRTKGSPTVRLGTDYEASMRLAVQASIQSAQIGE